MIGKFVVIDTLDNFKSKLSSIPSSAIVLIKDVGQIYAHGTYFGARNTCELLNLEAAGLAPAGGINANGLISNVDSEWVLTVTNGKDPVWKKLPANAFSNNGSAVLEAATTSDLGGIKVGSVYNGLFSTLTGKHYTVNIDSAGLAYVSVPWDFTDLNVKQTSTSLLSEEFSLLFSHTADDETHTEGTRKASNLKFNPSTGTLTTTNLKGNIDSSYINKLTGYSKAKSVAAITTSDTLNTALGKLEHKADVVYDLVAAANPDSTTIDTLQEVLSVLSGITDTQTVQGILGNYLLLAGGTMEGDITFTKPSGKTTTYAIDFFEGVHRYLFTENNVLKFGVAPNANTILHSGNYSSYALPLSGGVIEGMVTIKRAASIPLYVCSTDDNISEVGIRFTFNSGYVASIAGKKGSETLWRMDSTLSNKYQIWDSGNDGADSGLDADLLDGKHADAFALSNTNITLDSFVNQIGYGYKSKGWYDSGAAMMFGANSNYYMLLQGGANGSRIHLRANYMNNGSYVGWKDIAFTDSNVASATKLETARTIWGQSFDGTGNVSGTLELGASSVRWHNSNSYSISCPTTSVSARLQYHADDGHIFKTAANTDAITILRGGNVGIGTTNPAQKLHVEGGVRVNGQIIGANSIISNTTNGFFVGNRNDGLGVTDGGLLLYTYGKTPISFYANGERMRIDASTGNVGIGTASPTTKLEVNGTVKATAFSGNATSAGNSDTVDNYHISVTSSPGTSTSTIYFVT